MTPTTPVQRLSEKDLKREIRAAKKRMERIDAASPAEIHQHGDRPLAEYETSARTGASRSRSPGAALWPTICHESSCPSSAIYASTAG